MILSINQTNFDDILAAEKTVLLDFYADWCGPCRMVAPFVEEIAQENPQLLVGKINVDEEPELARRFGVMSIPTLVVMKRGEVVNRAKGAMPKAEILALLSE
ncbi:MAG: thioredoxin [Clostridia bacterium]|nr:thioredoxin [Clostridia bacterium]